MYTKSQVNIECEDLAMTLSKQSLEIMLDLIEMKIAAIQIQDRDDARELSRLGKCRQELLQELGQAHSKRGPLAMRTLTELSRVSAKSDRRH